MTVCIRKYSVYSNAVQLLGQPRIGLVPNLHLSSLNTLRLPTTPDYDVQSTASHDGLNESPGLHRTQHH